MDISILSKTVKFSLNFSKISKIYFPSIKLGVPPPMKIESIKKFLFPFNSISFFKAFTYSLILEFAP